MTHRLNAAAGVLAASVLLAGAATAQQSKPMPVIAVSGCVSQDGSNWLLTSASAPLTLSAAERSQRAADNIEWARKQREGTERYRLIGRPLLEEFKIEAHKGHRIVVRGLVISDTNEKRVNVISLAMVAASCS